MEPVETTPTENTDPENIGMTESDPKIEATINPDECPNCIVVSRDHKKAVKDMVVAISELIDEHFGQDDLDLIMKLEQFAYEICLLIDAQHPEKFAGAFMATRVCRKGIVSPHLHGHFRYYRKYRNPASIKIRKKMLDRAIARCRARGRERALQERLEGRS